MQQSGSSKQDRPRRAHSDPSAQEQVVEVQQCCVSWLPRAVSLSLGIDAPGMKAREQASKHHCRTAQMLLARGKGSNVRAGPTATSNSV